MSQFDYRSLGRKVVKTRKPHDCLTCHKVFPPGTIMLSVALIPWPDWDKPVRYYLCKDCEQ